MESRELCIIQYEELPPSKVPIHAYLITQSIKSNKQYYTNIKTKYWWKCTKKIYNLRATDCSSTKINKLFLGQIKKVKNTKPQGNNNS